MLETRSLRNLLVTAFAAVAFAAGQDAPPKVPGTLATIGGIPGLYDLRQAAARYDGKVPLAPAPADQADMKRALAPLIGQVIDWSDRSLPWLNRFHLPERISDKFGGTAAPFKDEVHKVNRFSVEIPFKGGFFAAVGLPGPRMADAQLFSDRFTARKLAGVPDGDPSYMVQSLYPSRFDSLSKQGFVVSVGIDFLKFRKGP